MTEEEPLSPDPARAARFSVRAVQGIVLLGALALAAWAARADDRWFELHRMRHYCVIDPSALTAAHASRAVAAVVAVLLVMAAWPLGRRIGPRLAAPRRLLRAAWPSLVAAIIMAVVVADVVLRVRDARRRQGSITKAALAPLRHRGRQTSEAPFEGRTIRHILNEHGLRTRAEDTVTDFDAPTLVISGESVALGVGLDYDDTIAARLSEMTGLANANLAVSGTANDEALYRLREWLPRFRRPVAIVTFVLYQWLDRNVDFHRQRLVVRDGRIVLKDPLPELVHTSPLLGWFRDLSRLYADEAIEVAHATLRETADLARRRGAYPLFVVTQCGAFCITKDRGTPAVAHRIVLGLEASTIFVDVEPSEILVGDIHPNARGAARYAAAIEAKLHAAGVLGVGQSDQLKSK